MNFEKEELLVIHWLLKGALIEMNERIGQGQYFGKDEKEIFEIMKSIVDKLDEST